MVVDDDIDIMQLIKTGLERLRFEIHGFSDPVLVLQHLENGCNDCEVLVTDVRMPNMNGFQLVRRAREIRPDLKTVMMTAFEMNKPEFETVFPSMQVQDVIRKPSLPSKLIEIIRKIRPLEEAM
jgi:DNA-binding NtrC family response regulator